MAPVPFSYRRSKKVGPFTVSIGKRGPSVSAGGRGARIGVDSRGRKRLSVRILRGLRWFKSWR